MDGRRLERAVRAAVDAHLVVVEDDTTTLPVPARPDRRGRLRRPAAAAARPSPPRAGGGRAPGRAATRADRVDESVSSPSTSTAPATTTARSSPRWLAADAAEAFAPGVALRHLERAFELWDVGGPAPAQRPEPIGCGRPPSSPAAPSATNERSSSRATRSRSARRRAAEAWGHERLGRYLWASGQLEESVRRVRPARPLCSATTRARGRHRRSPGSASRS